MIAGTRGRPCLIVFGIWAAFLVPGSAGAADRLRVVATTVQVTALTREVAGDLIELRGIVPAGADPHEFEPVASDLVAVERARSACSTTRSAGR